MKNFKYLLATFTVAASLCACSTGEYVVDLKTPITVENINQGTKAVCVADVTDNRLFIGNEAKPNLHLVQSYLKITKLDLMLDLKL